MKKKIVIIGHRYHLQKEMQGVYHCLEARFELTKIFVDDGWPSGINDIQDHGQYDACIWFVRFRELMLRQEGFDWGDFSGTRIMLDWDACQNFHYITKPLFINKWPEVFHKNNFHVLVCTGKRTRDELILSGVPSYWLPKAYEAEKLSDTGQDRSGICYYGNRYLARKAMLHYLESRKIAYTEFKCTYAELNSHLNKYLGCLVCNMSGVVKPGINKIIHRFLPSKGIDIGSGGEPMQKNFEVAAAGCAPIVDYIDELGDLGFEDGKTMVSYTSFAELADKLKYYKEHPEELREIGINAARLALDKHTWDKRAESLLELINSGKFR